MIKIKDLQYRSLWYKKNYYYLKSGQSLSASTKISANCQETTQIHQEIDDGLRLSDILSDVDFDKYFSNVNGARSHLNLEQIVIIILFLFLIKYQQRKKYFNIVTLL